MALNLSFPCSAFFYVADAERQNLQELSYDSVTIAAIVYLLY